jgi:hypothetical protein
MSANRAKFVLMTIFVGFLVVQLGALFHVRTSMWPEDFDKLILRMLAIYSAPLGIVLGGMFSLPKNPLPTPPPALTWSAMALAVLWNLLLVWRTLSFSLAAEDSATDLVKYLDSIAAASSFLVAGVIVFFFGKTTEPSSSAP